MKKMLLRFTTTIILFLIVSAAHAQVQFYDSFEANFGINPIPINDTGIDGTGRHSFAGTSSFSGTSYKILWSVGNNRWEIQYDDGSGFGAAYVSTVASTPYPPNFSFGAWTSTPFAFGETLTSLSGDVQGVLSPGPSVTANAGSLTTMSTTYGTASALGNTFTVSGTGLTAAVLVTPPAAFEVSTDNATFSNTVTLGSAVTPTLTAVPVYIRLKATTFANTYTGQNVVLSTTGTASVNVALPTATVLQKTLTVTANNQTKVYGAVLPALTASYAGFVNGDTPASLTTVPTVSTTATAASSVAGSPYPITAAGGVSANYAFSYVAGALTVTAALLTVTVNNQTKVYAAVLPTLTAGYTGFVNGDTPASLTTPPTLTTTATIASSVAGSPYAITASGAVSANYTISYVPGTLTVTAAALTITATNKTKVYGAPVPTLTASYTGFVNGDTPASLTTQPTLTTTATAASPVAGSPYSITASGAVNSNYTITYTPGSLTVTAAALTIVADNQTKVYGAAVPTLTASYTGFVNGDSPASLTTPPTLTTTATAAASVAGNPYAITASGAVSSNYTITYTPGSLTVTAAALTIVADNQTKVYGAAVPTLTASYTGFVNGDSPASLTAPPTLTTTATAASPVAGSPYAITASGAVNSNYTITYTPGTLTVTAAALTIVADNQTKVYGAAVPTLTASYTGFVNGDSPASLTTPPTLTTTATAASPVAGSPYAITASGAVSSNYTITYTPGTLTVTAAALTIVADNQTKVYGAAVPTLTASYTGFVNGDSPASLIIPPTLTTTATAASSVAGSPYAITASGAASTDYTISYAPGTLTVTAAALTIVADNQTKVYGAAVPTLTASYTGFVNGDSPASLIIPPTLTTTATAASSVAGSPYAITASGAASTDYTISYTPGTLTVTAAALTIVADNQTKVYGAAVPTLTASYTGFVNGDTNASLTTQPTLATTATAASSVAGSPYPITASGAVSTDYTISYTPGTLTVTAAALTIVADNQTKVYGAAVPTLTASYTGFVNGDTNASLTTQPTLATTATAASSVAGSPYAITASGAASTDYTINYTPGTLTVTAAALTIVADNQTKVYGAAVPTLTASYTGFVNGDTNANLTTQPTLNTTATAASSVAGSPYAITASGAVSTDYTISYTPGTLTVTAAALTIIADNQTKVYGAAVPTLTASYTGFVNEDTNASLTTQPTLATTATAASSVAGSPYAITASGAASTDYTISYTPGTLTVTAAALTIVADNQTKVYGAAVPTLTASYTGFVNGDTNASLTTQPTLTTTATAASSVAGSPYAITASGAVSTDYTISYTPGTLTVTAAALTIVADNQTKVYGAAVPTLTASYTGFVNGDTNASLTTQPTLNTTATAASSVAGSPYAITASGAASTDYTISYTPGTLTVTAAALTIVADNQTKVYGAAVPTLTASYTGFVNGDTNASLTTQPTLATTATAASSVAGSPYAITAGGAVSTDYTISYTPGTLTVTAAALTIIADNQTKVYGAAVPTLTASYTGFVNGDTNASLTTQPTLATTALTSSPVNTYPVTASGAASTDYTISYTPGTLTVTAAALTIIADNQTKVYGAAVPTLTASYTGFVNGDTNASLTTQPTLATTAVTSSPVNTYPVTASGAASNNYTINYTAGTLTVTNAVLTITADNQTKVYGSANPALTVTYSGFVNGDTNASLTTQPTLATTATAASAVNTYPVTVSGAVIPNYSIVYVPATLSITKAVLTITADNKSRNFGVANPVFTITYSGFVNGDDATKLTAQPTAATTAVITTLPGNYPITASGALSGDYSFSYVNGTLTIAPLMSANVTNLTISAGTLSPSFAAATHSYTTSVDNTVNSISFTTTFEPTATLKIDGSSAPNGSPSMGIPLKVGNNTITLVVTAQDGIAKNTYEVTVYRGEPAASVTATNILTPNGDGKNDTWVIEDINLYPKNSVKVFDRAGRTVYAKQGYSNDWDGTLKGAPLNEGTYFYTVDLGPGLPKFKGFITLLRSN